MFEAPILVSPFTSAAVEKNRGVGPLEGRLARPSEKGGMPPALARSVGENACVNLTRIFLKQTLRSLARAAAGSDALDACRSNDVPISCAVVHVPAPGLADRAFLDWPDGRGTFKKNAFTIDRALSHAVVGIARLARRFEHEVGAAAIHAAAGVGLHVRRHSVGLGQRLSTLRALPRVLVVSSPSVVHVRRAHGVHVQHAAAAHRSVFFCLRRRRGIALALSAVPEREKK